MQPLKNETHGNCQSGHFCKQKHFSCWITTPYWTAGKCLKSLKLFTPIFFGCIYTKKYVNPVKHVVPKKA